ncbi:D-glycerate dehydrogenase [Virgibacillus halodenitrificans]|uniref:Glyoxylate/hydroxypyruvate reductase B n=1 Tax=Virgibacillus halodenitrificans TaxID=1482 RepID=A0AAC9J1Q1_VIRHA|nr:D-glycerate dehydrogenase [Virgibacillus halodenitrificans]APC48927.1 D-glycerate dehydrogenase [Virgibacillus halodenitrificans]CDQ30701.1 Glyoxylate/hydroxypyruvate reductase B [Virgibacillus halodenitrificans]
MRKPTIFITRKVPGKLLESYKDVFDIRMWEKEEEPVPREVLEKEVKQVDGLLCVLSDQVDQSVLNQSKQLKVVANMAVGFDNININYAKEMGVIVTNTPDVLSESTADLGFTLMMATARRLNEAAEYIKDGQWKNWAPFLLAGTDVHNKTLGIVGMGRIGEAIARRAKGFGMTVLYHNRKRKREAERELQASYVQMDELLSQSDFVISVVPFTKETNNLFNKEAFEKMKESAVFVNISRGAVVDENALYCALKAGEIKAAGLDVFEQEPISSNHPLLELENVICLPHIGSATVQTRTAMIELCLKNIANVLEEKAPLTPVN